MFSNLKQGLRRRLLGRRLHQRLIDDHRTLGLLGNRYYQERHPEIIPPGHTKSLQSFEYSCYSQNGEDGIILYLLSRIKVESYFMVEIGTEDGRECNSANLILNYGWYACLIETNPEMAREAKLYFSDCDAGERVHVLNERATPENINKLFIDTSVPRHADILSIDIDSHDYWLWEAIDVIEPRLVIIEYNASFGPTLSVTIPRGEPPMLTPKLARYYQGASITALHRLGKRKGYDLVGVDVKGVNAFFIRQDLTAAAGLKPAEPEQVFRSHFKRTQKKSLEAQLEIIKGFDLTEIE